MSDSSRHGVQLDRTNAPRHGIQLDRTNAPRHGIQRGQGNPPLDGTPEIQFLPGETENFDRDAVNFRATVDGTPVMCLVSCEALTDRFRADFREPMPAFVENRTTIEDVARRLIGAGRVQNGELLIRSADL